MTRCKACGAEILWIKTKSGKMMPCNPEPIPIRRDANGKEKMMLTSGEVVSCELVHDELFTGEFGFKPHWASCKAAGNFRKRQEGKA